MERSNNNSILSSVSPEDKFPFLVGLIETTKEKGEWHLTGSLWEFRRDGRVLFSCNPVTGLIIYSGAFTERAEFLQNVRRHAALAGRHRSQQQVIKLGYRCLIEHLPVFSARKDP